MFLGVYTHTHTHTHTVYLKKMFCSKWIDSELGCRPVLPTPAQSLIKLRDEKVTVGGLTNALNALLDVYFIFIFQSY